MPLPNHILLIEDDPSVARSLQEGLVKDGFRVAWKNTGVDGIAYANQEQPNLILLDIRLPDTSGFDVCRQIRRLGLIMPVIILTVQRDEIDRVLGLEIGADDYITKPFSLRELLSRVRAQLRRAYGEYAAARGELVFVRDLTIDLTSGQVQRADQLLNLTPTEFRLLAYLARHLGQALNRAQIIEEVWGHAPDLESERTVNVHIRRLREKVEPDPNQPELILTVPGIGYRMVGRLHKVTEL
jgi:DNA-binding response OmpR family regulator